MTRFGPYTFINMFLITVALFTLFPVGTNTAGFAALLWGFLLLSRSIWLFDSLFTRRPKTISNNMLPFILLAGMERRRKRELTESAHHIFNAPLFYWFATACLFGLISLITAFNAPAIPKGAEPLITDFLTRQDTTLNTFNITHIQAALIHAAHLGVIAAIFILVKFYAYTHKHMYILWTAPLALFLIQAITYLILYGTTEITLPAGIGVLPYLPGFIALWSFAENLRKPAPRQRYAALGIAVIILLIVCDTVLALPANASGLWLCGWTVIAVLWVRTLGDKSARYLLY